MAKDTDPHLVPKSEATGKPPLQFQRRGGLTREELDKLHEQLLAAEMEQNKEVDIKSQLLATIDAQMLVLEKMAKEVKSAPAKPASNITSIFKGDSVPEYQRPVTQAEIDTLREQYMRLRVRVADQTTVEISNFQLFIFEGHQDSIKNPIDFVLNNNDFLTWISQFLEPKKKRS